MDHTEAVSGRAVERYLLGEMTESEADSFERHFFECAVCSEELASGALLAENIRAVSEPESSPARAAAEQAATLRHAAPKPTPWWRRPLLAVPTLAAALLAAVTGYQAREIARLNQPQALAVFALRSETRGPGDRIALPAGASRFAVNIDLPDNSFPSYRCTLQTDSAAALFSVDSPAPPPGAPLSLLISSRGMHSGVYTLRIQGLRGSATGPEIARYRFNL